MELEFELKDLSIKQKESLLRALYRGALLELGYSPDAHIYDLDVDWLYRHKKLAASRFLIEIFGYYMSLTPFERAMFVSEILESGRHYKHWYLEFYSPHEFKKRLTNLRRKVACAF